MAVRAAMQSVQSVRAAMQSVSAAMRSVPARSHARKELGNSLPLRVRRASSARVSQLAPQHELFLNVETLWITAARAAAAAAIIIVISVGVIFFLRLI